MPAYILSKSTYIRGLQCLKSLYLNRHRSFLRDRLSEEQLAKFARGHAVGKIAQQLFPGGIEIQAPSEASARKTAKLITEGYPVIYEACFIHNEVIVAVDILVKDGDGWSAYEVKSSGSLTDTYYNDAYLQNYVIAGSGLRLKRFFLVHRDPAKEIGDSEDIRELFVFREIDQPDEQRTLQIESSISEMKQVLSEHHSPVISPGYQCMHPYPCDFRGFCWKELTDDERDSLLNI
jgi:hypothetical protein